ncbi:MAG: hypothetical protein P4L65_05435 [Legionella sp.]|nr:hypothetical protein [Legionella sp.]
MAYTLILLGTDTQFSPSAVPDAYDIVESLSYLATKIEVGELLATDLVTQYRNKNVAVVNGPTTMGTEIGDRIARGVEAILEALARGETDINIMAHSRGAVEAILVAHELQRIQDLFKNKNPVVLTDLTDSVCDYTKPAMRGASHKTAYEALNLEQIAPNIANAKISILNIDPVPGGNYMGITWATSLAWKDSRFYKVPAIVTAYEQYIYENERTRCFKPVVPKCDSPATRYSLASLPGHHGTGSGNLLDQQRTPKDISLTGDVQKLVVTKGIDFLTRTGVKVTPPSDAGDPFAEMLAPLFEGSAIIKKKLNALYFVLYNKIIENIDAYKHYNTTAYATLGKENDWAKLIWTIPQQRIVHQYSHNDTLLDAVIPPVPGETFLNYEHARLYLNEKFKLNGELSLSDTVSHSIDALINMCSHAEMIHVDGVQDMSQSFAEDRFAPAANDDKTINLLLSGLSMLIEEVKRPYLRGELIDSAEREKIYGEMKKLFTYFNKKQETVLGTLIGDSLHANLALTLETKRATLEEEYHALSSTKLQRNAFFDDFQKEFKQLISNIEQSNLKDTDLHRTLILLLDEIDEANRAQPTHKFIKDFLDRKHIILSEMEQEESFVALAHLLVTAAFDQDVPEQLVIEVIELRKKISNDSLSELQKNLGNCKLKESTSAASLNTLFELTINNPIYSSIKDVLDQKRNESPVTLARLLVAESLDDSVSSAPDKVLKEVIKLHKELNIFRKSLPDFEALYVGLGYALWSSSLEKFSDQMTELAGKYCVNEQLNLETAIQPLFNVDSLYEQIAQRAIHFGAKDPSVLKLDEAAIQIRDLKEQNTVLIREHTQLGQRIRSLELNIGELAREKEGLTKDKTALTEEKMQLNQQLESKISELTRAKEELEKHQLDFTAQKTLLKQQLELRINALTREKVELEKDKVVLTNEKMQLKQQIESQINQLTQEKTDLERDQAALTQEKDDLVRDNGQLEERIAVLEQNQLGLNQSNEERVENLQAEVDRLNQENNDQREILNNEAELQCQLLIKMKLIPLSANYLKYLITTIKKSNFPELVLSDDILTMIAAVKQIDNWPENNTSSEQLKQKFEKVAGLYEELTTKNKFKPSENVTRFYELLNNADKEIGVHRDSKWKRYTANTVAVLGIILTGVLPGLAVLAIVSAVRGKSAKFWQSEGQGFFDKSKNEVEDNPYTAESLSKNGG